MSCTVNMKIGTGPAGMYDLDCEESELILGWTGEIELPWTGLKHTRVTIDSIHNLPSGKLYFAYMR